MTAKAHLTLSEVRERAADLRADFDRLMTNTRFAVKPAAKQWTFFRESLDRLLGSDVPSKLPKTYDATQHCFEVNKKLRDFYLHPPVQVAFVFTLVTQKEAYRTELIEGDYPTVAGYVLLVSDALPAAITRPKKKELYEYLVSVVQDAARAEFETYRRLPERDLSLLEKYFVVGASAYTRVQNVVERHAKAGRILTEPSTNPSTMRVMKANVTDVTGATAILSTEEYWYLRWWSLRDNDYSHVYNETNTQRYVVVAQTDGRWLVDTNEYPPPRNTAKAGTPRRGR